MFEILVKKRFSFFFGVSYYGTKIQVELKFLHAEANQPNLILPLTRPILSMHFHSNRYKISILSTCVQGWKNFSTKTHTKPEVDRTWSQFQGMSICMIMFTHSRRHRMLYTCNRNCDVLDFLTSLNEKFQSNFMCGVLLLQLETTMKMMKARWW